MKIKKTWKVNKKIDQLEGIKTDFIGAYNWAEDMNSASYLLDKFAEEVAISKENGTWFIDGNKWSVKDKRFSMAICLAYIQWKKTI